MFDSPYGILPYYGCNGGLAGHTANVLKMAEAISNTFSISDKTRAILLTATILHGIGSTLAYNIDNFVSVESKEGVLLGVTNLSLKIVGKVIDGASNINDETALRVLHAIASHNGYASIKPATKEAVILKKAHQSDYSVVQVFDYIEQDDTRGAFTSYDRISNQRYLKDKP